MTISFSDWREYGENLGRFASIRERADSPQDRIVIQNKGGVQKVIAGDYGKTIIVTVGETDQPNGRAVVGSRLLLTTLKTLKGKGDAVLRVTADGAAISTTFGSEITLDNVTGAFKLLTPQPYVEGKGRVIRFDEGFLPSASKYLVTTAEHRPFNQVLGECKGLGFMLRSCDDHIMAEVGPLDAEDYFTVHFPDHVFPALKGLESAGGIYIPEHTGPQVHQAQFGAGKYRVICVIYPDYGKFPRVAKQDYTARVTGDRKVLVDAFKSLAGRHTYHRVVMEVSGDSFIIRSGDNGAAKVNIDSEGTGTLPVNASFIAKVLSAVDGKNATVEFSDSPSNVRVTGDKNGWPLLVSPMN